MRNRDDLKSKREHIVVQALFNDSVEINTIRIAVLFSFFKELSDRPKNLRVRFYTYVVKRSSDWFSPIGF
jgi:hypothetical protein